MAKPSHSDALEPNFDVTSQAGSPDLQAQLNAIESAFAVIRFDPSGNIVHANDQFLSAVGYSATEIVGKHHRMFVPSDVASSKEYVNFWEQLACGTAQCGQFRRVGKSGKTIWLQASYMPVLNADYEVVNVLKIAADITAQKREELIAEAKLAAISRAQAVIEFTHEGTILGANDNFLTAMGYKLNEIVGKHHSMFVTPEERQSVEYQEFWQQLRMGKTMSGEFCRVSKSNRHVWIQAHYNPILDESQQTFRVIKLCADITSQVELRSQLERIGEDVAASSEQMVATIKEISHNVHDTARIAGDTVKHASESQSAIEELERCNSLIENVVDLIQTLSEQTNLLALNATIEAARAGASGKSFAVVAGEVKNLSRRTAEATKTIESSVRAIRESVSCVSRSSDDISRSASQVSVMMDTIAAAVEEQTVTMSCISDTASGLVAPKAA